MKKLLQLLIIFALTLAANPMMAQKDKSQTPEKAAKEQSKLRKEREEKIESELDAKEKGHMKIQDKATRKRMKANRKKSRRIEQGKPAPFYKRWFARRKKHR